MIDVDPRKEFGATHHTLTIRQCRLGHPIHIQDSNGSSLLRRQNVSAASAPPPPRSQTQTVESGPRGEERVVPIVRSPRARDHQDSPQDDPSTM
jgi:hypothetical protein